jgi:CBS domain-containing protein
MRVEQLMTKQVKSCSPDDTLDRAAQLMWENDCGCIAVCAGNGVNRVKAVITDRDICMSALFERRPLRELRVADAMSKTLHVCRPGDLLTEAERIMREARIRRLPVVDAKGALVGIISLADLAREAQREQTLPKQDVTGNEIGVTLASICTPYTGQQLAA